MPRIEPLEFQKWMPILTIQVNKVETRLWSALLFFALNRGSGYG